MIYRIKSNWHILVGKCWGGFNSRATQRRPSFFLSNSFYVDSLKCSDGFLESVPCIRKHKELMLDFVRGIFGSMVDIMCGDYNENTTRCEELEPLPKSRNHSRKQYNNFVFLMIDLLDTIKSFDIDKAKLR